MFELHVNPAKHFSLDLDFFFSFDKLLLSNWDWTIVFTFRPNPAKHLELDPAF